MGQVAIHLVGGDMVEAERRLANLVQTVPVGAGRFQQHVGADDIGFDEIGRAGNGAIDVALGRQMHHGIGLMGGKHPIQFGAVADIDLLEGITLAARDLSQGFQVACIGQLIEVDNRILGVTNYMANYSRTDKTGAAGYKDLHGKGSRLQSNEKERFLVRVCYCVSIWFFLHRVQYKVIALRSQMLEPTQQYWFGGV